SEQRARCKCARSRCQDKLMTHSARARTLQPSENRSERVNELIRCQSPLTLECARRLATQLSASGITGFSAGGREQLRHAACSRALADLNEEARNEDQLLGEETQGHRPPALLRTLR